MQIFFPLEIAKLTKKEILRTCFCQLLVINSTRGKKAEISKGTG